MKRFLQTTSTRLVLGFLVFCIGTMPLFSQSREDAARGQQQFNTGNELLGRGDLQGAITSYSEAIVLIPTWHLPFMNRAIAYMTLGKLVEAEADATRSSNLLKPETKDTKLHLATIYQIRGSIKQSQKDYAAALEFFSQAIELEPKRAKFHDSHATALRMLGRDNEALASYNKAIELDKNESIFFINRASLYVRLNDTNSALADIDRALQLNKESANAYYTRASIRMNNKEFDKALSDYIEAIRIDPSKAIFYHARGLSFHHQKQFDLAIKDHSQAITLDKNLIIAYADRAIGKATLNDFKGAIEDLRSAIRIDGNSAILRYNLGYFLYQDRQYSEAYRALSESISIAPKWAAPYVLRSNCHVMLKRNSEAIADRKMAKDLGSSGRPVNEKYTFFEVEARSPDEIEK